MQRKFILAALLLAAFAVAGTSQADSWPAAQITEQFSKSRDWFVRVTPGKSIGDTVGFAGAEKGPYARAEFYRRQPDRSYKLVREITLRNPVAPVLFRVTDRGYLVTFDNWHNMGYGKAVVSYSPQGDVIAAYELKDLFSEDEVREFSHSVSSIWWRKETVYVREGQQSVYVSMDDNGRELIFDPETGAWQVCEQRGEQHLCRTANADREWRNYVEPEPRP